MALPNPGHDLHRETEAARVLLATYRDILKDDEVAQADMVEGSTNLHEVLHRAAERLLEVETLRAGLAKTMEHLRSRDARFERQEEHLRVAIQTAMDIAGVRTKEFDIGTISRARTVAKVVVTDEALIPAEYFKRSDPKLSKTLLRDAMVKEKRTVPGAEMSNGGETLHVHWR